MMNLEQRPAFDKYFAKTVLATALTLAMQPLLADEAESFDVNVKGKDGEIQLTYTTSDGVKFQDAMNFTVHDPNYGMRMLCKGTDGKYDKHSHTGSSTSGAINFDHDYKGDKRDACNDVSSSIIQPYWIANMAPVFYYDSVGSLHGCQLTNLPNAYGNYNRVKYDKLPSSDPLYNKTGMPMSAVYINSDIGMEFDATKEQLLIVGDVDDSNELRDMGASAIDKDFSAKSFNCDPRVGQNITLKNMATYSVGLSHTINFGYNLNGVDLIEPGQKDYPAYRIKVVNNTGSDIDLINTSAAGSYLEYCENTTPLDTVGYVFREAGTWIAAALKEANGTEGNYWIEDIDKNAENKVLDKVSGDKTNPLFSDCNDDTAPVKRDLFDPSIKMTVSAGETKDVTQMFVLNNFDSFYDISLSYQVLSGNNPTYTYTLSPTKAYKPITFNSGFHDITITLDNGNTASVVAETDTLFTIANELQGGENKN